MHPRTSWSETVIYEAHVKGFTVHPSSGVGNPGTFGGMIEKIPYLRELGVTAVELLPIQEFNEHEIDRVNPLTNESLTNYWGYSTISFFAPKAAYAADGCQVAEFKRLVKAMHRAGIEVILDIVFNHTAEGSHSGLPSPSGASTTPSTTCSKTGSATIRISRDAAIPSTAITPSCASSSSTASPIGSSRCALTGSASTWPRSWDATRMGRS
jgi:glycogen operon protein